MLLFQQWKYQIIIICLAILMMIFCFIKKMTLLFNITLTIMHLSLILTILDTRIILLKKMCQWNLEEMNNSKKRKTSDDKFQAWSDEETSKLLDFLEENFDKYQKGKKPEFYAIVSRSIIKTKSAESIKGRLNRLLEKYSKVKRQNNQSGSGRVDWKWMEQMERIFGYCENISPSYISNETTEYIDDETNEDLKVEKDDKKVVKRKKNNVESLIDVMNNISETKAKISEQRLELEMNNDFRLQIEKFEVEKKKWEFEREQSKMLHELTMKKLEFQMKQCNN
ncbi:hypothetical protein C1646_721239 [Rhizophagus diaphanus]|nr:hypothetical protein C1646_721239 [Rhizophagus diaphanus] [Rhizophagus sp. MUCL 43196]